MGVRRCRREDLVRIAKATGGTLVTTLGDLDGNESFDAAQLGSADCVEQVSVAPLAIAFEHLNNRLDGCSQNRNRTGSFC